MRLASCYFDGELSAGRSKWARLARVLEASAREQLPAHAALTIARLPLAIEHEDANRRLYHANDAKLDWWAAQVEAAQDGERLLLIDADTLILRPIHHVWDLPFDMAYTTKPAGRFKFNAGVIFLRVGPAVRAFLREWREVNDRMLADRAFHLRWQYRFGGINQSALGYLLRNGAPFDLRPLPCLEWNCEDDHWSAFDPAVTRILHIKAALRLACFHPFARTPALEPLAKLWRAAEQRALAAEGRPA